VSVEVNGSAYAADVEPRLLLADFLRDHLRLTGTHLGCEQGVCGTCTVQIDGKPARSCLTLAVQADGAAIRTVEGIAPADGDSLHPLQTAFHEHHALQCGYCTPGFLMSIEPLLPELRGASEREVREQLAGNLCRCTGYQNIVDATQTAVAELEARSAEAPARRAHAEIELEPPLDGDRLWAAVEDPRGLLEKLDVIAVVVSAPGSWRGRFETGAATIDGVLELLDLDDDRRVANYAVEARQAGAPGQVRGSLTLSLGTAGLALRLELELIGVPAVPDHQELEQRLRGAAEEWLEALARPVESAGKPLPRRRLTLLIALAGAVSAAWLAWWAVRERR
jgi:carbon-monoxide dehydrogenase small subunit